LAGDVTFRRGPVRSSLAVRAWPARALPPSGCRTVVSSVDDFADRKSATVGIDGATVATFITLGAYTWFIYGLGPSIPLLREELGTSSTVAGLHSLLMSCGVILAGFLGVRLVRRWRRFGAARRGIVGLAIAATALVAGSLLTTGQLAITLPAMVLAGLSGALAINVTTAVINDHHGVMGRSVLSQANAVAAAVGLVSPLAVGAATALGWTWRAALLLTVPLAGIAFWLITRQRRVPAYDSIPPGKQGFSARGLSSATWLAALAVVAAVAVEFCSVTWTPDLLTTQTHASPGTATGAVAAVVGGMAVGRFLIGWLAKRRAPLGLFLAGLIVTVAGWVVVWTTTSVTVAIVGLLIVGMGIAGQFPLGISMVMAFSRGEPDRAVAISSIGFGAAAGLGPFALGALADAFGVKIAFLVVPACCVFGAAAVIAAQRSNRRAIVRGSLPDVTG